MAPSVAHNPVCDSCSFLGSHYLLCVSANETQGAMVCRQWRYEIIPRGCHCGGYLWAWDCWILLFLRHAPSFPVQWCFQKFVVPLGLAASFRVLLDDFYCLDVDCMGLYYPPILWLCADCWDSEWVFRRWWSCGVRDSLHYATKPAVCRFYGSTNIRPWRRCDRLVHFRLQVLQRRRLLIISCVVYLGLRYFCLKVGSCVETVKLQWYQ